ncbi:MAG: T9SS type A sorting domain-containing protein, partial [Bacteroidales bacterium]|nr:T9SS type A sorting domain-containing protein [Bacteroidales bacterium]
PRGKRWMQKGNLRADVSWPNLGEPQAFMAFNPSEVPGSGITSHEGDRVGIVMALTKGKGRNNDWLISPKLKMPSEHASVSFYTKAFRALAYPEEYNVWVSATTDELDEFMQIGETYTAPADWERTVVDLEMFNNKEIYIAIQCVSNQAWIFMIDDIEVSRPAANEKVTDLSAYVKSYPNPVADVWTVTAYGLEINRVEICDMAGSVVFRSAGSLATDAYRVHMGGFKPGLYMARVYTNAGVQTLKVVVR